MEPSDLIAESNTSNEVPQKKNRPKKSLRLSFAFSNTAIDVGLWESRMSSKGKLMPSSISLRLQDANPEITRNAVYFKASDALKLANVLQNYAYSAMESDSEKRIELAREQRAAVATA